VERIAAVRHFPKRVRADAGFALIELLVASALMILVIGATLDLFTSYRQNGQTNQAINDAQDGARNALDQMSRELRDATGSAAGGAVIAATPWELDFQRVNPNSSTNALQYVRYCLDTPTRLLWRQTQPVASGVPATVGNCPDPSWPTKTTLARNVSNGGSRRVFTYNSQTPGDVNAPAPALTDINSVLLTLYLDASWAKNSHESQLASGVFLRNVGR
jgi:type II secretory pathway pseudopilin PulG